MAIQPHQTNPAGPLADHLGGPTDILESVADDLEDTVLDIASSFPTSGPFGNLSNVLSSVLAFFIGLNARPEDGFIPGDFSEDTKEEFARKSTHVINPITAPSLYATAINRDLPIGGHFEFEGPDGQKDVYEVAEIIKDDETGFDGRAVRNLRTGGVIVLAGGLGENEEGHGFSLDPDDVEAVGQAVGGIPPHQMGAFNDLLERAASIGTGIQVIGYSGGSLFANHAAAHGIQSVAISNLGMPDLRRPDGTSLYTAQQWDNMAENMTNIVLPGDQVFGVGGYVPGARITLPDPDLQSIQALDEPASPVGGLGLNNQFNQYSGSIYSVITGEMHHIAAYVAATEIEIARLEEPEYRMVTATPLQYQLREAALEM